MFDTIHHIAIIGSDYEQSKHFYVDLLGLKVIRENYRKERDDYKIDLACGPQEIELFIIKNAPARVNYPEALGLRHLAFKVESVDDTVKELNGKGIETEPVRLDDYTGKKMTFFHDPDGLPLEIHEQKIAQDRKRQMQVMKYSHICLFCAKIYLSECRRQLFIKAAAFIICSFSSSEQSEDNSNQV